MLTSPIIAAISPYSKGPPGVMEERRQASQQGKPLKTQLADLLVHEKFYQPLPPLSAASGS